MTMPKAVFFGLALIALAVVFSNQSVGQQRVTGAYAVSSASDNAAWRINSSTGQVSFCRREFANAPAKCGGWSR